tara:strand:- start:3912 stop:4745 length:834 start_codon:yes stop_codon:yes gene_type:complete
MSDLTDDVARGSLDTQESAPRTKLPSVDFATREMAQDLGGFIELLYMCTHHEREAKNEHGTDCVQELQELDVILGNYARTRLAGNIAAIELPLLATAGLGDDFIHSSPFFHPDRIFHQRILYGFWKQNLSGDDADYETHQTLRARFRELGIDTVFSEYKFYRRMYQHRSNGYYDGNDDRVETDRRHVMIKPTRKATREWRISCIAYMMGIGRVAHTKNVGDHLDCLGRVIGEKLQSWEKFIQMEFNTLLEYADFDFSNVPSASETWDNVKNFDIPKI